MSSHTVPPNLVSDEIEMSRRYPLVWTAPHPGRRISLPPTPMFGQQASVRPGVWGNSFGSGTAARCDASRPMHRSLVHKTARTKPSSQRLRSIRRAGSIHSQTIKSRLKDDLLLATLPRPSPTWRDRPTYFDPGCVPEDATSSTGGASSELLCRAPDHDLYGWDAALEAKLAMEARRCSHDDSYGHPSVEASQASTRMSSVIMRLLGGRSSSVHDAPK